MAPSGLDLLEAVASVLRLCRWGGKEAGLTLVEDFCVTGRALSCESLLSLPEKETEA